MKSLTVSTLLVLILLSISCTQDKITTFQDDVETLKDVEGFEILKNGNALLAVSSAYQGRIFTSSSMGMAGRSYGYFNRDLIKSGDASNKLSALGGESRMIFGPEVGKYAIFFAPGTDQNAHTIEVSPELNRVKFNLLEKDSLSITCGNTMNIRNANNYQFKIGVKRRLSLKTDEEIEKDLAIRIDGSVSSVAFGAETWITNISNKQWSKEHGLLAIWDLGCMIPSDNNTVIIPLSQSADSITTYFTAVDHQRLVIQNNTVLYKADANYMNKIGVPPHLSKNIMGSYSPELNLLNIVKYNFTNDSIYVNSLWGHKDPYQGDVTNIFNGEVNPKEDRNWPFYEFESSSSAKELKNGEGQYHYQNIYHFEGSMESLNKISKAVLGIDLNKIDVFKQSE